MTDDDRFARVGKSKAARRTTRRLNASCLASTECASASTSAEKDWRKEAGAR